MKTNGEVGLGTMWRPFFFHWLYSPLRPWPLIFQFHDRFTDGRTSWTSDQLVARPLPKHRTTQTQNKHIHIPNIHAMCGFRTHDLGFRASEDSICLRPLGYRDRRRPLYPRGNRYQMDRRLGGHQSRSGSCGEVKNVGMPGIKPGSSST
jgi:hypothetical protein